MEIKAIHLSAKARYGDDKDSREHAGLCPMTIETVDPAHEADALGEVLHTFVLQGASVNFVLPFSRVASCSPQGSMAAWSAPSLVPATQPNQPHRAEIAKMLVHPDARRRGVGRALLTEAETIARRLGRTLLTLDTKAESAGERLYRSMGYVDFGVVPGFALDVTGEREVAARFFYKRLY